MKLRFINLLISVILLISSCGEKKGESAKDRLGILHLQVSGKAEALPHFEKGMLLLHSFQYSDA